MKNSNISGWIEWSNHYLYIYIKIYKNILNEKVEVIKFQSLIIINTLYISFLILRIKIRVFILSFLIQKKITKIMEKTRIYKIIIIFHFEKLKL